MYLAPKIYFMQRTFKSKIGSWMYVLILFFSFFFFIAIWERYIIWAVIMAVIDIWLISMLLHTEYIVLPDETLLLKSGYAPRYRIKISDIVSVGYSKNARLGYAISFDRLVITWNSGRLRHEQVSPRDKEAFIILLKKINPSIIVEDYK